MSGRARASFWPVGAGVLNRTVVAAAAESRILYTMYERESFVICEETMWHQVHGNLGINVEGVHVIKLSHGRYYIIYCSFLV